MMRLALSLTVFLGTLPAALAADPAVDLQGDPMPAGAVARLGSVRFRQVNTSTCLSFSNDDKLLVTGAADGVIHLWEVANGRDIRQFKGHQGGIAAVRFTPDGKYIVSSAHDASIRMWDVSTGKEERSFSGHQGSVLCLAVSSDSKTLYSAGFDHTIRIWDLQGGKEVQQLVGHQQQIYGINLSPDDKQLVSAATDGTFRLWDIASSKELLNFQVVGGGRVDRPTFSTDGKLVFAAANFQGGFRSWDSTTGKEVRRYPSNVVARALTLSPGGKFAAMAETEAIPAGSATRIKVVGLASGEELRSIEIPGAQINDLGYSHNGKLIAACCTDSLVRVVEVSTGKMQHDTGGHMGAILALEFASDGKNVFSIGVDRSLRTWDAQTGKELGSQSGIATGTGLATLAVREGGTVVCTDAGRRVLTAEVAALLRGDANAFQKQELSLPGIVNWATASADGKLCAASGSDNLIRLIDCEKAQEKGTLPLLPFKPGGITISANVLALSADGRFLAARCSDGNLRSWDVQQAKEIRQLPTMGLNGPIVFAPDGRSLLTADAQLRLWEQASGRERWRFNLTRVGGAMSLAFAPDGQLIAIGFADGTLSLRAFGSGKELTTFASGQGQVRALRFSPDGQRLASGGADSTILLWDVSEHAKATRRSEVKLDKNELAELWHDLAEQDAGKAHSAIDRLAAGSEVVAAFIKENLKPPVPADAQTIAKHIADLDADDVKVRDSATIALEEIGEPAVTALQKVLEGAPTLEVRTRVQRILERRKGGNAPAETLRGQRAIEVLELLGSKAGKDVLEGLAKDEKATALAVEAKLALERMKSK